MWAHCENQYTTGLWCEAKLNLPDDDFASVSMVILLVRVSTRPFDENNAINILVAYTYFFDMYCT